MSENKTKPTDKNVQEFLESIEPPQKREDSFTLLALMKEITGEEAQMWGETMIGFGSYHYKYASGREGDSFLTGFSPRKQNFSVYITAGFDDYAALLGKLGKHKTSKSCLYINKLKDVDMVVLRELVQRSFDHMRTTNPRVTE